MTAISTSQAQAMLHTMADMQEQHNVLVHPQWREQGFEFYRAMWVECRNAGSLRVEVVETTNTGY